MPIATDEPLIIVSSDCHIGPRLREDLRPYCPQKYLADFDDFERQLEAHRRDVYRRMPQRSNAQFARNRLTEGHYEASARQRDLDFDGVAAEIIFHGSQNEEPIPFGTFVVFLPPASENPELVAAGRHIYNQWLADFVSMAPERHIGLCQLAIWDVDAACRELEWAHAAGLRGVNFPAPRSGLPMYNDRVWEPFWERAASLRMPLTTHSGSGNPAEWTGPEATALMSIESGGWFSRRALHQMIFGGVFERHPDLQLVLTEQPGDWWSYMLREYDSAYEAHHASICHQVPRRPSEYIATNVSIGGSFLAQFEARDAIEHGYANQLMWGSDYPHMEGTYQHPDEGDSTSVGKLSLRATFAGVAPEHTAAILGENAVRIYDLDRAKLAAIAQRIGAPTIDEIAQPLGEVPANASRFAFRSYGPWA